MFVMGASLKMWLKLLWQNRFNVGWKYIPRALAITLVTGLFYPLVLYEKLRFNRKINKVELKEDPIFIVGHWRTGTTHLQNLLLKDKKFGYLDMVEATFPHLMLGSFKLIYTLMKPLIPEKRAMDNMDQIPETPQEHEFVLTNLCLHSPLTALFFPYNRNKYMKYGSFEEASEKDRNEWKEAFRYYLKKLSFKEGGKQLLLKNPIDTYRLKLILEIFPNAKFINIYRDPYKVFFSTVKLHKTNTNLFWLQEPDYELEDFIFELYVDMYKQFYKDLNDIPKNQIIEIKYEDLIANPIPELEKIYKELSIGNYEDIRSKIETYLDSLSDYKVGKYKISAKDKKRIYSHWHETIDRWGYDKP